MTDQDIPAPFSAQPRPGQPSWFEIGVPDAARATAFYTGVFGWTPHPTGGDQSWLETAGVAGGVHDGDQERRMVVYFAVADIDAAVATVRAHGGTAEDPGPSEPPFGRFTSCTDDQGVAFGLHQAPAEAR